MTEAGNITAPTNGSARLPTFVPRTDIIETKDALLMYLDMPGADPETLDVTLENRELTVTAKSVPFEPNGYALVHGEYRDGNYERYFLIMSDQVDEDQVEAEFKDGVLTLTLPKSATSPAKKIPVKAD
jgi:HSP20 family molecular chaperone IbpA